MVLLLRKLYLYFTKDPEGSIIFQGGGGCQTFSRGGLNANFFRNPYTYTKKSGQFTNILL